MNSSDLALFEIRKSFHVDVALGAFGGSFLVHEAVVGMVAHVDGFAELAHFHAAVLDQSADLSADLVGVLRVRSAC